MADGIKSPYMIEIPRDLLPEIRKRLDVEGVMLFVTKDKMPCKDEERCGGHPTAVGSEGIRVDALPTILRDLADKMEQQHEKLHDEEEI